MAETSSIEWTDATWNPITGCTIVDAGCTNCYAMDLAATRLKNHPSRVGLTRQSGNRHVWTGELRLNEEWIDQPLRWTKPRMIFVCAHGDLFHEKVPDEWIDRIFAVMALCPQHTFQVLTKRPERARDYLTGRAWAAVLPEEVLARGTAEAKRDHWPLPNVWLGTSISDQDSANDRIPHLLASPAKVRFLSAEPLLGPVDLEDLRPAYNPLPGDPNALTGHMIYAGARGYEDSINASAGYTARLNWVIVGGESGRNARPMHPDWARSLRDQCQANGTAFFFKQWGEWKPRRPAKVGDLVNANQTLILSPDGRTTSGLMPYSPNAWLMDKAGKVLSGRELDGQTWDQLPTARNA